MLAWAATSTTKRPVPVDDTSITNLADKPSQLDEALPLAKGKDQHDPCFFFVMGKGMANCQGLIIVFGGGTKALGQTLIG